MSNIDITDNISEFSDTLIVSENLNILAKNSEWIFRLKEACNQFSKENTENCCNIFDKYLT